MTKTFSMSAKCSAYAIFPRKYSALMNANATAMGTPSSARYSLAASKFAFGEVSCFARSPETFAGERRKIVSGTLS